MKKIIFLNLLLSLAIFLSAWVPGPGPMHTPEVFKAGTASLISPTSDYILTITLKKGLKWSDDTALTTRDMLGTYNILWAQVNTTWTYIDNIIVKDDQVVEFNLNKKSGVRALMNILRANIIRPYSVYGKWMDQAAALRQKNADVNGDEVKQFLNDLLAYKPTDTVVSGPYKLNPTSITAAQVTMLKNPKGYNAGQANFDKLIMYYGETNQVIPWVMSGDIDYTTHGFPVSTLRVFQTLPNYSWLSGTTAAGAGLWFNHNVYPLNKVEVRQAFAYIIDRKQNADIAFGDPLTPCAKPIQYMAGFTDTMVPGWLSNDSIDKLNPYAKDDKKAADLLTQAGATKGGDGIWVDDRGNKMEFEISVPSDFADWFETAKNAAQQLSAFGIKTTVRGYSSSQRTTVQSEGQYQILVDLATYTSPPHPQTAFNYVLNTPRNNPNTQGQPAGMNYSWTQKGPDGQEIDLRTVLNNAAAGLNIEKQKPYLATLAWLVNTQLPYLPLWERVAVDPINIANVTGWKPLDDKIYKNNQGSDNYIAIQLLNGTLTPTPANTTKKFASAYPYPFAGSLNLWSADSIPVNLGAVFYPLEYPPLFWYLWADNLYSPVLAEKYELKIVTHEFIPFVSSTH